MHARFIQAHSGHRASWAPCGPGLGSSLPPLSSQPRGRGRAGQGRQGPTPRGRGRPRIPGPVACPWAGAQPSVFQLVPSLCSWALCEDPPEMAEGRVLGPALGWSGVLWPEVPVWGGIRMSGEPHQGPGSQGHGAGTVFSWKSRPSRLRAEALEPSPSVFTPV